MGNSGSAAAAAEADGVVLPVGVGAGCTGCVERGFCSAVWMEGVEAQAWWKLQAEREEKNNNNECWFWGAFWLHAIFFTSNRAPTDLLPAPLAYRISPPCCRTGKAEQKLMEPAICLLCLCAGLSHQY